MRTYLPGDLGRNAPGNSLLGPEGHHVAPVERLALRLEEVAAALGISRRLLERERSAGRFPRPDRIIGRMPLWSVQTVRTWVEGR